MSDLVGNPKDRFSHNEAQLVIVVQHGDEPYLVGNSEERFSRDGLKFMVIIKYEQLILFT